MNGAGHLAVDRPGHAGSAHNNCLPAAANDELADFSGTAPRTVDDGDGCI